MKRNPRFGPQLGERVRVRGVPAGYPLRGGLKERDIVLLKSWERGWYRAEFEGREVGIMLQQIIQPAAMTDGRMMCKRHAEHLLTKHRASSRKGRRIIL